MPQDDAEFEFREGHNPEDTARDYETPYNLDESDEKSLADIRSRLEKGYSNKDQAREHLVYLEHLLNRLASIQEEEGKHGIVNETLPNTLQRVSLLLRQLQEKYLLME